MVPGGRLTRVVVRENALKDDETDKEWRLLVDELVGYVNDLLGIGQYTADEIPALAMQAYHADYYLVQVINGGHSQFIGNSPATLKMTCSDALAGLESMGARTHHKILEDMMAWMEAHPDEADAQDGFSNRAAALEALDKRFDEAESIQPMSTLATLWIAAWPDLHAVSPNQYDFELERISQLNPHRAGRRLWKSVQMIRFQMTDPLQITIAAACGAARPIPEYKLRILPGLYMDVEGQQCLAFGVETEWGSRICIQEDGGGGRLYESSIRPLPDFEGILAADILKYGPRTVGARLSVVTSEKIQSFTAIAEKTLAAVAIDLLLRKSGLDTAAMITAVEVTDKGALWGAVVGGALRRIITFEDHAKIVRGKVVELLVPRAEIERHARMSKRVSRALRSPNDRAETAICHPQHCLTPPPWRDEYRPMSTVVPASRLWWRTS